ncbi:MAG: PQQ-dependent sugar dehydrogenase [Rhodanobacter sp.]
MILGQVFHGEGAVSLMPLLVRPAQRQIGSVRMDEGVSAAEGGASAADRWSIGNRVRDIEEAPDGTLWMLEDAKPGGLFHLTPK